MANWKLKVGMLFDSQEFEQGVQRIDKQLKVLDSELKMSQSSVANFGNSTEQLKTKASSLSEKIELQKTKVEGLRKAYEQSVETKGEEANATQNLQIKLNNATTALNNMEKELKEVKDELKQQPTLLDNFSNKVDTLNDKLYTFGDRVEKLGNSLTTKLTAPIIAATVASVKMASDLEETLSKTEVVFGECTDTIMEWSETSLTAMGLSQQSALDGAALYGDMATALGLTQDQAAGVSMQLVQLSADMASFKNTSQEMAQTALAAIFTGETEALKKYGIVMTETNLQEFARTQGITKSISAMNQQEKVMLRLAYVTEVTKNASGDFQRTNQGFANQSRILTEGIKELGTVLGNNLLPQATQILQVINGLIAKFTEMDAETQSSVIKMGAFAAAIGPGLVVIGKLTKGVSSAYSGINLLTQKLGAASTRLKTFATQMGTSCTSAINKFISKIPALGTIGDAISNKIAPLTSKISGFFAPLTNKVGTALQPMIEKVQQAFGSLGTIATTGASKLQKVASLAMKLVGPFAIVGLLLAGLGLAQSQFGEQLDKFLIIAIEKAPGIISGFVDMITAEIPRLIPLGIDLLMNLLDVILANVPVLIDGAVSIIVTLAQGVGDNVEILLSKILDVIFMLVDKIIDNLPLILQTGLELLLALTQGIVNNIDKIIDGILSVILQLIDFIASNLPLLIDMGIKLIVALAQGLVKAVPKLLDSIPVIISAIFDAFKKIDWGSIGKSIIDGLVAGLKAAKDLVVNTLKSIATGAIDAFKKFFGINSPSKVFMSFGQNIDQGLSIGLDDNLDKVEDSMDNLMNTINFVPDGLDYELTSLNPSKARSVPQVNNTTSSTTNKNVNIYLTIERFENNREQDVEELMSEMEYIARKELIGNGGVA